MSRHRLADQPRWTRRDLGRAAVLGGLGSLVACSRDQAPGPDLTSPAPITPTPGQRVVTAELIAAQSQIDIGGATTAAWAYGDSVPGPLIRATAGDLLRVQVRNQLSEPTTVHWHGIRLPNGADGVPDLTQPAIEPGASYSYEFVPPDPGTYFFHPHVGLQLDRGLYGTLIIDDPAEPGDYDLEWIVVLDDWLDGTTPEQEMKKLVDDGVGGMGMGAQGPSPFGAIGQVAYPYYLVNGRGSADPQTFTGKPGDKVRLRIINAGSDTLFTVGLGGHELLVTHSDGWPVQPRACSGIHVGMGERFDATLTLADGVFALVGVPFGKQGVARAVVRTGSGEVPGAELIPPELTGQVIQAADLAPADSARLDAAEPAVQLPMRLNGTMNSFTWGINGKPFGDNTPLEVSEGQRARIQVSNMTMMAHPLHIHGHTFATPTGLRKDTILVGPMGTIALDLQADNPGRWAAHCHNIYHAEAGMMILLNYGS